MTYKCSKSSNVVLTFKCSFIISDIDGIKHFLQTIHGLHHKIDVERLSKFSLSYTMSINCRNETYTVLKDNVHYDSYHCEEVFILHNKLHPPPPILPDDTKVGRCKFCISRQHLEVVTKPHSVYQLCGGGDTRDLHTREEMGGSHH